MRIVLGLALILQFALLAPATAEAQSKDKMMKQEARLQAIPGTAGRGPLKLTSSAAVTYQEYFAHACPLVLLVEEAGWATHASLGTDGDCPAQASDIPQTTIRSALNACNTYAANRPCSVIAIGRKIVWEGKITYLPGPFVPHGGDQRSVVLRKTVSDDDLSTAFETAVGIVTYNGPGQSGTVTFQRHDELGVCTGSIYGTSAEAAPVSLSCTKVGAITGTVALASEDRTGAGMVVGANERSFTLTILPKAEYISNGTAIYEPPATPEQPMTEQKASGVTG